MECHKQVYKRSKKHVRATKVYQNCDKLKEKSFNLEFDFLK